MKTNDIQDGRPSFGNGFNKKTCSRDNFSYQKIARIS